MLIWQANAFQTSVRSEKARLVTVQNRQYNGSQVTVPRCSGVGAGELSYGEGGEGMRKGLPTY